MRKADPLKLDQVRDEILRAAMELFTKYGIDKTTMENIAEAAGKGKSTLYYYFKTKEDVFSAATTVEHGKIQQLLEKELRAAKSAADKVRLFFRIHENSLRTKVKLYPIIFKESKKHIPLFHGLQRMNNTTEVRLFRSILEEGIASREFKSIKPEDCEQIAIAAISSLHAAQLNFLLDGKTPSPSDRTSAMLDIFIRGLK